MSIVIKPSRKGLFTAKAKAAGMSVQAYADKVLADPNTNVVTKRQANFARNAAHFKHGQKTIKKAGKLMRQTAGVK
jgi:hypothetical protein